MPDPLVLAYAPSVSVDYLEHSGFRLMTPVNSTLAIDKSATGATIRIFIHGNIRLFVRRGGANVSRHFAVRRAMRVWTAPLNPGSSPSRTGAYQNPDRRFLMDSTEKPVGHWWDCPGIPQGVRLTSTARLLYEWVIACEDEDRKLVPGIDGLYFFMLLDHTPAVYRISYSPIWSVTPPQVTDVLSRGLAGTIPSNRPWRSEDDVQSSEWVESHTDWVSYAAHNDQLIPPGP
jgi:hypothetical protein